MIPGGVCSSSGRGSALHHGPHHERRECEETGNRHYADGGGQRERNRRRSPRSGDAHERDDLEDAIAQSSGQEGRPGEQNARAASHAATPNPVCGLHRRPPTAWPLSERGCVGRPLVLDGTDIARDAYGVTYLEFAVREADEERDDDTGPVRDGCSRPPIRAFEDDAQAGRAQGRIRVDVSHFGGSGGTDDARRRPGRLGEAAVTAARGLRCP